MPFVYTKDIPTTGQKLGNTRAPINSNFQAISEALAVDHFDFNLSDVGKHKWVRLPSQSSGIPATAANELMLVAKSNNLFLRQQNTSTDIQIAMGNVTGTDLTRIGSSSNYIGAITGGWTFLPGGLILNYGFKTAPGTPGSITYAKAFSAAAYSIVLSLQRT